MIGACNQVNIGLGRGAGLVKEATLQPPPPPFTGGHDGNTATWAGNPLLPNESTRTWEPMYGRQRSSSPPTSQEVSSGVQPPPFGMSEGTGNRGTGGAIRGWTSQQARLENSCSGTTPCAAQG